MSPADAAELLERLRVAVGSAVLGNREALDLVLVAMLCRGHVLLDAVPGVGKTVLARSLAAALGCRFRRVQMTPDVLPSDITGANVYNEANGRFEFRPGSVFTELLLADEINRATPRTRSALLEAMEERQVTVDGTTSLLAEPFLVLATQSPIALEGSSRLSEAQLERFVLRARLGYPSSSDEATMLRRYRSDASPEVAQVCSPVEVRGLQNARARVTVDEAVGTYLLDLVAATRHDERVELGASPRASLALQRAAQAAALIAGRGHVLADDVKRVAVPVLEHRLAVAAPARRGTDPASVLAEILDTTPAPVAGAAPPSGRL